MDREIGRGAMGVVFLASDPVIGRTVALKTMVLPPGLDEKRRAEYFDRFLQEARAAGRLSHPGIVTIHDAGRDDASGRFFLAMEYVRGRTLRDALPMPEPEAVEVLHAVASALAYAHAQGIVHRDLKPANILLGDDGSVKITDFGIARVHGSDLTRSGESLGSPAYMSPEQVLGRPVDGRSDLFALGILAYEMLGGERPFAADDLQAIAYQVVHEQPRPIGEVRPGLSPRWDAILGRLLGKRPEERYLDAAALLRDLEALRAPSQDPERTVVDDVAPGVAARAAGGVAAAGAGGAVAAGGIAAPGDGAAVAAGRIAAAGAGAAVAARLAAAAAARASAAAAWLTPRLRERRGLAVAGAAALVLLGMAVIALVAGNRVPVQVSLKHGLEEGRLRVQVDGGAMVDVSFVGEKRGLLGIPGLGKGGPKGGSVEVPLRLSPGEHEFAVEVASGDELWTRTITRTLPEHCEATLEIRVATKFSRGLMLELNVREGNG